MVKMVEYFFKFNSLTDKDLIIKLSEASMKRVKIKLIIRGISCLRPGVKDYTENIEIRSIVGRYLEHPRIYIFGKRNDALAFISSADLMTRNTEKRIEVTSPILGKETKEKLFSFMDYQWMDNTKARVMNSFGEYDMIKDDKEPSIHKIIWWKKTQ